MQQQRRKSV